MYALMQPMDNREALYVSEYVWTKCSPLPAIQATLPPSNMHMHTFKIPSFLCYGDVTAFSCCLNYRADIHLGEERHLEEPRETVL